MSTEVPTESKPKKEIDPNIIVVGIVVIALGAMTLWGIDQYNGARRNVQLSPDARPIGTENGITFYNDHLGIVLDLDSEHFIDDPKQTCQVAFPVDNVGLNRCVARLGDLDSFLGADNDGQSTILEHEYFTPDEIRAIKANIKTKDRYTFTEMERDVTNGAYALGGILGVAALGWAGKEAVKLRRAKFVAKQQQRAARKAEGEKKREAKKNSPTPTDTYDHLTDGYVAPSSQVTHEQAVSVATKVHPDTAADYANMISARIALTKILVQLERNHIE